MSPLGASADGIWGPFLTRCLLFLTSFYFLVVFPSGFGLSPHGWAWWPYLTVIVSMLLLSCCWDTWLWSWAGLGAADPWLRTSLWSEGLPGCLGPWVVSQPAAGVTCGLCNILSRFPSSCLFC